MFAPAVKTESKLRLAFTGPAGGGKTYSALSVATALVPGGRVALLDTEHGSAAKYADIFQFDTATLEPPFHPDRYIEVIRAAAKAGYDVLIIDSMSHAWTGTGGLLDVVNEIARAKYQNNTFMAWKDGTPIQNRLIEAILHAPLHVIATMRSKTEYAVTKDEKTGKSKPEKIGTAPVQRDGFEYEYDVIIDLGIDNMGVVNKTRCPALTGKVIDRPGKELAATLRDWLHGAPPPAMKQFTDGSIVPTAAMTHYDAYVAQHDGRAAENVDALREWVKSQKNGSKPTPPPTNNGPAAHGLIDQHSAERVEAQAAADMQSDLFGDEYDARQEEVKADLATAQGKAN